MLHSNKGAVRVKRIMSLVEETPICINSSSQYGTLLSQESYLILHNLFGGMYEVNTHTASESMLTSEVQ